MIYKKLPNASASKITVTTTATLLQDLIVTAGSAAFSLNEGQACDGINYNIESGSIRVTFDGNTPTTSEGLLLSGTGSFFFTDLTKMRLISTSGSVSMSIQVGFSTEADTAFSAGQSSSSGGGSGDVVGPASSTDNALARYDGTTGKLLQNGQTTEDDNGTVTVKQLLIGNRQKYWDFYDDFDMSTLTGWATSLSGGTINTQQTGPLPGNHIGQLRFQTSNTNDRASLLRTAGTNTIFFGNGETAIEFAVYLENLSDVTNEYELYLGFGKGNSGNPVDGVFIRYIRTSSVNWSYGASSGGTATVTNSSVAVAATTYLGFKIVINASGTSAEYFIGNLGTGAWTSLGTVTTNIPTSVANICTPFVRVNRTAGVATTRNIWVDYSYGYGFFTTPRF